jgi:hypothetical protein
MPFIKPYRKIQRFRRMFETVVVDAEAADDLTTLVKRARRIVGEIVREMTDGGTWYSKELVRQRRDVYVELRKSFEANGLPIVSSLSQMFSHLDRGLDLSSAPLVFGNRAKSIHAREEVEVFVRCKGDSPEVMFKCGTGTKAKTYVARLAELPSPEWFVQSAELSVSDEGRVILRLIVVRTLESVEAGGLTARKPRPRPLALVRGKLFALKPEDVDKLLPALSDASKDKLDSIAAWIERNRDLVAVAVDIP